MRIADQIPAMLAYWDCDQVCVFANNAYHDWFGKSRAEMVGISLEALLGPLYPLNLPFFQAALGGRVQVFERAIPLPDGTIRHSIATYTPDIIDGEVRGVIVHVADVTPVKQLEQELRKTEALRAAHDELEQRVAERTQALTEANHQLDQQRHALAVSEGRYRALVQNLPDVSVLMFDHDLRYLLVEGCSLERHGYNPTAMLGRTLYDMLPSGRAAELAVAYRNALVGQTTRLEHIVGAYIYESCFAPVYDTEHRLVAGLAVIEDITERRRLEQKLREREQIYSTLFEVLPIGVMISGPGGQIRDANPTAERLLTLDRSLPWGGQAGGGPLRIIRPDGSDAPPDQYAGVRAQREQHLVADVKMGLVAPDRQTTWLSVTATPMPLTGYGVVVVSSDITEHIQMEQALRATLAERETLLKEIHHRVKNNLQVVMSLLRLQSRGVSDPGAAAALYEGRQRIETMALVHELLYQASDLATVDADAYIRRLSAQLARSYIVQPDHITLTASATAVWLSLDQAMPCGLIINELLVNSLKYAFPDGRPGAIEITLTAGEQMFTLTVRDTGVGLPPQPVGGRRSLGLQLVHDLARQLRGTVRIDSPPGTTVTVTFPISLPPTPAVGIRERSSA